MHTAFTRMSQDQALLPATINGPSPQLPAIDGDMQVDVLELKLKYATRLSRGLSVRAGYDYRDRENKTQFKEWPQVSSDSWHQGSATPAAYDHTRQRADIAFNYRFTRALSLDAGYEYKHHSYSDLARESLFQSSVFAKLNLRASRDWQLWFKGELSERSGGSYQASELSQSPNNPWMRQYWLADRKQTLLRLQNDYRFSDALSFSLALNHKQQDYDETLIGLDEVSSWGYGLSGNYQFSAQFGSMPGSIRTGRIQIKPAQLLSAPAVGTAVPATAALSPGSASTITSCWINNWIWASTGNTQKAKATQMSARGSLWITATIIHAVIPSTPLPSITSATRWH